MSNAHAEAKKAPKVVEPLSASERLALASRIIRALKKLPPATQKDVLAVVGQNIELADALYAMTNILRDLDTDARTAVVQAAALLVGEGAT
jgi:hypothetical protein